MQIITQHESLHLNVKNWIINIKIIIILFKLRSSFSSVNDPDTFVYLYIRTR